MRSELGKLPAELKNQYYVIYNDKLGSGLATAAIAQRTFSWMLAAQRALTIREFISAVALDDNGEYHDGLDAYSLLDICRNFITFAASDSTSETMNFQFSHLSVKEFLENVPDFCQERVHTVAVSRCLAEFKSKSWVHTGIASGAEGLDGLRAYRIYLFEHAAMSELQRPESTIAPSMKDFLFDHRFQPTLLYKEWLSVYDAFLEEMLLPQETKDLPLYHKLARSGLRGGIEVTCAYGLLSVLCIFRDLKLVPWISYRGKLHITPLYAAVKNGQFAVAEWLLEHGVVGADEIQEHAQPLYRAVRDQKIDIVALLLEHGADPLSSKDKQFSVHHCIWHSRLIILISLSSL